MAKVTTREPGVPLRLAFVGAR